MGDSGFVLALFVEPVFSFDDHVPQIAKFVHVCTILRQVQTERTIVVSVFKSTRATDITAPFEKC